jgi:hypothetical protein
MLNLIERQAARHDCLPWLLGDVDTYIEKVFGGGKNIYTGLTT